MAEAQDRDQKTEQATPKRRREAAEKGDVLQSRDLGAALVVLAGAAWLMIAGPWLMGACGRMLADGLSFDAQSVSDFTPGRAVLAMLMAVALPVAALFAMTLGAAIGTPALLGSLGLRWSALAFKPERIDPLAGAKRIFGPQGLIELGKALAKISVLAGVAWWLLMSRLPGMTTLGRQDIVPALGETGHSFTWAVMVMALALTAIAGVDVPAQMIQRAGRLRMTKQEVKDEQKQTEGSPEVKAAVRRRQHQVLRGSARTAVKEASVVLVNPTHFAVALRYRPGIDAAPLVVARGRGVTAQSIRALAEESLVPVLHYPQLARAIYFTAQVGYTIREDLYMAVATVLAFVFNLDRALADGVAQPQVEVPVEARFDEDGRRDP